YWIKSGGYNFFLRIFGLLFNLASFLLLVRILPKDEFGIWALFTTITALIEMARNGLIQNGLIRHIVASDKEKIPEIITASFALNGILTLVSITILVAMSHFLSIAWNSPELKPMFIYYIFTTIFLLPYFH